MQSSIQDTIAEISAIVTSSDLPVNEKAVKVKNAVQEKVHPLLVQTTQTIQAYIADARNYISGAKEKVEETTIPAAAHDHNEDVPSFVAPPEPQASYAEVATPSS